MKRRLPPCYADLAEGLDGDSLLQHEDLELALRQVSRGAVPGVDGLPYEFYRTFQNVLVPVVLRVFNAAFRMLPLHHPVACSLGVPFAQLLCWSEPLDAGVQGVLGWCSGSIPG